MWAIWALHWQFQPNNEQLLMEKIMRVGVASELTIYLVEFTTLQSIFTFTVGDKCHCCWQDQYPKEQFVRNQLPCSRTFLKLGTDLEYANTNIHDTYKDYFPSHIELEQEVILSQFTTCRKSENNPVDNLWKKGTKWHNLHLLWLFSLISCMPLFFFHLIWFLHTKHDVELHNAKYHQVQMTF
jgi:hypothetical protein